MSDRWALLLGRPMRFGVLGSVMIASAPARRLMRVPHAFRGVVACPVLFVWRAKPRAGGRCSGVMESRTTGRAIPAWRPAGGVG